MIDATMAFLLCISIWGGALVVSGAVHWLFVNRSKIARVGKYAVRVLAFTLRAIHNEWVRLDY